MPRHVEGLLKPDAYDVADEITCVQDGAVHPTAAANEMLKEADI
ncbi:hypothetical protein Ait01nite_078510 [Actinoplanes italicus]|uniref:Uncharacterized protein n=1 Tax=Actinoplanes italicus TaxID=113567 RepID=A0A2T0JNM2_9ACTN|nr:hypothetical protein [Actinoplanes italicus]PRX09205.1 hypothetical protein CLV67_13770 [Actinoplanes italicus]GIE34806.1 hypothetical protein Ait01nite_078510 [Actinoplanes italicus]